MSTKGNGRTSLNDAKPDDAKELSPEQEYVSQIYRASATQMPSERLDANVLSAAKLTAKAQMENNTQTKHKATRSAPFWYKWQYSGALAASILVVIFFIGRDDLMKFDSIRVDESRLDGASSDSARSFEKQPDGFTAPNNETSDLASNSEILAANKRAPAMQAPAQEVLSDDAADSVTYANDGRLRQVESDLETNEIDEMAEAEPEQDLISVTGSKIVSSKLTETNNPLEGTEQSPTEDNILDELYTKANKLLEDLLALHKLQNIQDAVTTSADASAAARIAEPTIENMPTSEKVDLKQNELYQILIEIRDIEGELWELEEDFADVLTKEQAEALEKV